jgi:hypothetical protein
MLADPSLKDKYDKAIDYLMEYPKQAAEAWMKPDVHPAGCLFQFVTNTGYQGFRADGQDCGCLTQVKAAYFNRLNTPPGYDDWQLYAWTDELTEAIANDENLPKFQKIVYTREELEHFANWQRRLDREIRGKT